MTCEQPERVLTENDLKQIEIDEFRRFQFLDKLLGSELAMKRNGNTVLEVNCGAGGLLRFLRASGWRVSGIECCDEFRELAISRYGLGVLSNENREGELLKASREGYDLILVSQLKSVVGVRQEVLELTRYLRNKKGRIVVQSKTPLIKDETLAWITSMEYRGWYYGLLKPGKGSSSGNGLAISSKLTSLLSRKTKLKESNEPSVGQLILPCSRFEEEVSGHQNRLQPKSRPNSAELRVVHLGYHHPNNAGDTVLYPATRLLWQQQVGSTSFTLQPVHGAVTAETIDMINAHDALLIGGGGLFLPDTNENSISGWQWACPTDLLERIDVPIFVLGVGYNRFKGQQDFAPVFRESVSMLIQKSRFFGLRNSGSVEALKEYIPDSFQEKLSVQPCPTTLLSFLLKYDEEKVSAGRDESRLLSLNIAMDRPHLRFGDSEDDLLWEIADAGREIVRNGWDVQMFAHSGMDTMASVWLQSRGLNCRELRLKGKSPAVVVEQYRSVTLAVGMRGHSQLIPFGLGCPIFSLITHPKLQFFLDDIGCTQWGTPAMQGWGKHLLSFVEEFDFRLSERCLREAQGQLWQQTLKNTELIRGELF